MAKPIQAILVFPAKLAVIWMILLISAMLMAMVLGTAEDAGSYVDDGPLSRGEAFLVVNGLHALVLTVIGTRARIGGLKLVVLIGISLFAGQSFLLMIEAMFFSASVAVPTSILISGMVQNLLTAIGAGLVSGLLWVRKPECELALALPLRSLGSRLLIVSLLYVLTYMLAGYFIAWDFDEVRRYYGDGVDIPLAPLLAFQIFRGLLWGLLAWYLAFSLKGSIASRAAIIGATFSILACAQLLYPNAYMPWPVRFPHLVEVGISNFLFGVLAAVILLANGNRRNAIAEDPAS